MNYILLRNIYIYCRVNKKILYKFLIYAFIGYQYKDSIFNVVIAIIPIIVPISKEPSFFYIYNLLQLIQTKLKQK